MLFLLLGIFMISSPSVRVYAAEDSSDGGGDSGSNDSNGGRQDESSSSESKDEGGTQEEDKQETNSEDKQESIGNNLGDGEGEKEKAAQEDYEQDKLTDSELQNVKDLPNGGAPDTVKIPKIILPRDKDKEKQPYDDPNEWCDSAKDCYGPGHTPNGDSNCLGKYCGGEKGQPPVEDYCKYNKWDTKKCGGDGGHEDDCKNKGDWNHKCKHEGGDGNKDHWNGKCSHWWSNWNCHHGKHHHNNHDNHNHRDSKHTHTSTSGGHGDLDLVINIDHYNTKSASKLKDFNLQIDVIQEDDSDNVYDKNLDLSKMPDKIKISHLDIDKGDIFLTQLVNNDAEDGDSYLAVADEDTVSIYITAE
jgi:hypothetical protein